MYSGIVGSLEVLGRHHGVPSIVRVGGGIDGRRSLEAVTVAASIPQPQVLATIGPATEIWNGKTLFILIKYLSIKNSI